MKPFDQFRRELDRSGGVAGPADVRADIERGDRAGVPEVVLARGKTAEQLVTAIRALLGASGRAIVSGLTESTRDGLRGALGESHDVVEAAGGRAAVVARTGSVRPRTGGRVAVVLAGTSDIAVASEAVLMAEEMGCDVRSAWDVGVAGLHRLIRPLEELAAWDPDVFIVAAGMDGVLPAVIAGLVSRPVIGLPVSTGYGFGGEGHGALTTMLQSCAPGVAVVNIDNGVGAGAMAGLIANRAAHSRSGPTRECS